MRLRSICLGVPFVLFLACGGDDGGNGSSSTDVVNDASTPIDGASPIDGSTLPDGAIVDGSPGDADTDAGDAGVDAGDDGGTPYTGPPSCAPGANGASGLSSCGTTEPGAESCCSSLPLPVRTTRSLDKYEITAGRLRAFIDANPNVRAFANAYATAHPDSELGQVLANYPGLLDILPNDSAPGSLYPLSVHLGVFPLDPINTLDGCYMGLGGEGHATYWQTDAQLDAFRIPPRMYDRDTLDQKPVNCVMPLMLATFCAWDGGELARTQDYQEIWGTNPQNVLNNAGNNTKVYVPWATLLDVGQFNWRNGHGEACPLQWPGCVDDPPDFYAFPSAGRNPSNDNSPEIAAGGRFSMDVTAITSANGDAWYDVGANLMEAAWPVGALTGSVNDVCNVTRSPQAGDTTCTRAGSGKTGIQVFTGGLPQIALVGYSFEGHSRRSETYLRTAGGKESLIAAGDRKPVTFQYGKVGGRCAR